MGPLRKFLKFSASDRRLLLEATMGVFLARLTVRLIPFRYIRDFLSTRSTSIEKGIGNPERDIRAVEIALSRAERLFPRSKRCLPRAIAAFVMLRRRGYQPILSLGLRSARDSSPLAAHAWISVGCRIVADKDQAADFTTVLTVRCLDRRALWF
jgi:hypothetical protein